MPNYLGIDIGYSNLKAAKTTAADTDALQRFVRGETEEDSDLEFSILCRPAGAIEASKMPRSIFKKPDAAEEGISVTVNDVEWRAGVDFTLNSEINRELSPRYIYTDEWKALFYAALAWSKWDEVDTLVLGLPCNEFYTNEEARTYLKQFAIGKHSISSKRTVEVHNVIIAPQPIGSLMGYMLSDATPEEERHLKGRSTLLVLDPGYYSFDFVAVQNSGIMQATAESTRYSVREVCREVEKLLSVIFPDSHLPDGEIEHAIREDEKFVYIGGKDVDISDQINTAVKTVATRALAEIRTNLSNNKVSPRIILLTGGGGKLFEEEMRNGLQHDEFMMSDAAVLMNSFGYLSLAINNFDTFH